MIHEIGSHRFRHGDVTKGISDLMRSDKAQIMYSDPPWGEGNIKYWATMNKKMTGDTNVPVPLDTFLGSIFDAANRYVSHYLLIEYGIRWADMIQKRGEQAGFQHVEIIKLLYRAGGKLLPLDLHLFSRNGAIYPEGMREALTDSYGYKTVNLAFERLDPSIKKLTDNPIVLDPCCGMGYSAQAALDYGFSFRGNELNRKRLDKTLARFK